MTDDEREIREVFNAWHKATADGDVEKVLTLMSEDVVFLVTGRAPIRGRAEFAELAKAGEGKYRFASEFEVRELSVHGDVAYAVTWLAVTMTPSAGVPIRRSGHTLTILRKIAGAWVVSRDANLLTAE